MTLCDCHLFGLRGPVNVAYEGSATAVLPLALETQRNKNRTEVTRFEQAVLQRRGPQYFF